MAQTLVVADSLTHRARTAIITEWVMALLALAIVPSCWRSARTDPALLRLSRLEARLERLESKLDTIMRKLEMRQ